MIGLARVGKNLLVVGSSLQSGKLSGKNVGKNELSPCLQWPDLRVDYNLELI